MIGFANVPMEAQLVDSLQRAAGSTFFRAINGARVAPSTGKSSEATPSKRGKTAAGAPCLIVTKRPDGGRPSDSSVIL